MIKLLLNCCDATGILTLDDVSKSLGHLNSTFFAQFAISDDVYCNTRVNITDNIKVYVNISVYFDDILLAHLAAVNILYNSNGAVKLVKSEQFVKLHAATCCDVVNYNTVLNGIDLHAFASFRSLRISTIRMIFPLNTCLK